MREKGIEVSRDREMYKNQLQELAQRSCFNLPSYTSIREGPDHAPRFKAAVNFNGEIFESPGFCTTLRQAEHSAAEAALTALSQRGPSYSLAARILVSINFLFSLFFTFSRNWYFFQTFLLIDSNVSLYWVLIFSEKDISIMELISETPVREEMKKRGIFLLPRFFGPKKKHFRKFPTPF